MGDEGVFVLGTDTGVGKTVVSAWLAGRAVREGKLVGVMKPVATGGIEREGKLVSTDALFLAAAAGCKAPIEAVNPLCYRLPAAPPIAAAREGKRVDLKSALAAYRSLKRQYDHIVVEGVGGVHCPLSDEVLQVDWVGEFDLPVVLTVPARLGMIGQSLAAIEGIRGRGLEIGGVIVSKISDDHIILKEDIGMIEKFGKVEILGILPHSRGTDPELLQPGELAELELGRFDRETENG